MSSSQRPSSQEPYYCPCGIYRYKKTDAGNQCTSVKDFGKGVCACSDLAVTAGLWTRQNCPAIEWISNFLEEHPTKKLVVFAHHRQVQDQIFQAFSSIAARIQGNQDSAERHDEKERFQHVPLVRAIVCSIGAAKEAITLHAASDVLFVERDWTPGNELQCEDRCHRICQKNSVTIWRLMSNHPMDEALAMVFKEKEELARLVYHSPESTKWDETSINTEIMSRYKKLVDNQ